MVGSLDRVQSLIEVVSAMERQIRRLARKIDYVILQGVFMGADLTVLSAQVQANTDVEASAVQLIEGLAAQIASLKNDPVALQALADKLKASSDALAAAVVANTPQP